jgi:hypothetical protein
VDGGALENWEIISRNYTNKRVSYKLIDCGNIVITQNIQREDLYMNGKFLIITTAITAVLLISAGVYAGGGMGGGQGMMGGQGHMMGSGGNDMMGSGQNFNSPRTPQSRRPPSDQYKQIGPI